MAYKFSLGTYRHSGSLVAEEGLTIDAGGLIVTGSMFLPAGAIGTADLTAGAVTTAKIADSAVTTAKIADGAVTTDKLSGSAVTTAKIADLAVTVDKLGSGSVTEGKLGSGAVTEVKLGSGSVTEGKIATGAVSNIKLANSTISGISLGSNLASLSASATSGLGAFTYNGASSVDISLSSSVAGDGLGLSSGVLSVNVDASSIEISSDSLRVKASGVTNAMLAGSIVNDKLSNSSVTVTAGSGLSGGGSVSLGSSVTLDVAVNSDALEISSDAVALKSTISGNRTFSGTVTVGGDLIVTGNTFSASVGTLLIEDSNIVIADGALALAAGQGFSIGSGSALATFQVGTGTSATSAFVSSLELKASKFIGAVEGAVADSTQTLTSAGTITATVVFCSASSAPFTVTLPTAVNKLGEFYKVKKIEGTSHAITVAASGSQTIDGVSSVVLESPFAAVMLVSNNSNWFVF